MSRVLSQEEVDKLLQTLGVISELRKNDEDEDVKKELDELLDWLDRPSADSELEKEWEEAIKDDEEVDVIDALLKGLNEPDRTETQKEVDEQMNEARRKHDIAETRVAELRRNRLVRLEEIMDKFARDASCTLSTEFNDRIEINPISIDMELLGTYLHSIPCPCDICVIDTNLNVVPTLAMLDARMSFTFIDRAFGNTNAYSKIEGREYTKLEKNLLNYIHEKLLDNINSAWREHIADVEFSIVNHKYAPHTAQIASWEEPVYVIRYEVEMPSAIGSYEQVIPHSAIARFYDFFRFSGSIKALNGNLTNCVRNDMPKPRNTDASHLDDIDRYPIKQLSKYFMLEHVQTHACIASLMSDQNAATYIANLPAGMRAEVVYRTKHIEIPNTKFLEMLSDRLAEFSPNKLQDNGCKLFSIMKAMSVSHPEDYAEIRSELEEEGVKDL